MHCVDVTVTEIPGSSVGVEFVLDNYDRFNYMVSRLNSQNTYSYAAETYIQSGDIVIVPFGFRNEPRIAKVVSVTGDDKLDWLNDRNISVKSVLKKIER